MLLLWKWQTLQMNSPYMSLRKRVAAGRGRGRPEFHAGLTGVPLDGDRVRCAREEEMTYLVDSLSLRSLASPAVALADLGGVKTIPIRWVDLTKGSLVVVAEMRFRSTVDHQDKAAVFASTPPLEAVLRALITCNEHRCFVPRVRDGR